MDSPLRDMETEVATTLGRMVVGWVGCFIIGMYVAFLIDNE
jgi:hypothetical protein